MVENAENNKESSNWLFSDIANKLKDLFETISWKFKELLWIQSQTEKDLKELKDSITWISDENLSDKNLNDEEKKVKNLLEKNSDIKNWFNILENNWLEDELYHDEIEKILQKVKAESLDWESLDKDELSSIAKECKDKSDLVEEILKDDNIKDLNPVPTKKDIIKTYNEIESSWWTISKDNVITKIKEWSQTWQGTEWNNTNTKES